MWSQPDFKIILAIMIMAVVLAMAVGVAYFVLLNRPEFPEGSYLVEVEDRVVLVESDSGQSVKLVGETTSETVIIADGGSSEEIAVEVSETETTVQAEGGQAQPTDGDSGQGGSQVQPPPPSPIPPTAIPPTPVPPPPMHQIENYQVVAGDTLFSITQKRNTTISLMARFGISAATIVPGTIIPLPVANPAFCPGSFPYIVEEGDTLSTIAFKCGTTVDTIKQLNGFGDTYRLDVTDVVCVPNPP